MGAAAVTPHDTNPLADPVSALYIGGAGNVKVVMENGETVTFIAIPVGTILPIAVLRVFNTDTTATNIIGLK